MKEHLKQAVENIRAAQLETGNDAELYGKLDDLMHAINELIEEE